MFATELELGDAALDTRAARWAPSCFTEIRDVLPATRPAAGVVIHTGDARPALWRQELREPGRHPRR